MRSGRCGYCVLVLLIGACDRGLGIGRALAITTAPTLPRPDGGGAAAAVVVTGKSEVQPEVRALSDAFANAAEAIRPSVVRLDVEVGGRRDLGPDAEKREFLRRFLQRDGLRSGAPGPVRGTASGVIIDTAGYVLTTSHVTHGATKLTIRLVDRRSFPGRLVGTDLLTDIGVVKFEHPPPGLVAARLGNSDNLRTGEWSSTRDMVSPGYLRDGIRRTVEVEIWAFAYRSPQQEAGESRIGARLENLTEQLARSLGIDPKLKGVVVTEVEPGGRARGAGLAAGDVIREIDEGPVSSAEEAVAMLEAGAADSAHVLRIISASGPRSVTVRPRPSGGSP